jgi:hypothetical protein
MLTLRTLSQIANSRTIPSFRSCRRLRGGDQGLLTDQGRMMQSQVRVLTAEAHRQWLQQQWQHRRLR